MQKYIYKGIEIEYSGFKIEDSFCFYGYFENKLLYLTQTQIDILIKEKEL